MADMLFIESMHDGTRDLFRASISDYINPILIALQLALLFLLIKRKTLPQNQLVLFIIANALILLFAFGPYNEPYMWGWPSMLIPILLNLLYLTAYLQGNLRKFEKE